MKTPDRIWIGSRGPSFASQTGCEFHSATSKKLSDTDTEYIKASTLKDLAAAWVKASEMFDRQGEGENAQATLTCAEQLIEILGIDTDL